MYNCLNVSDFSEKYEVRELAESDISAILSLELSNPLYYDYCPPLPTVEDIKEDMNAFPEALGRENKYYAGYFNLNRLIAVIDLLVNYPQDGIAFIGFFMVDKEYSGNNIGSDIIDELMNYLKESGIHTVRLGYVIGNPQSEHFWKKNRFKELKKTTSLTVEQEIMLMERKLHD